MPLSRSEMMSMRRLTLLSVLLQIGPLILLAASLLFLLSMGTGGRVAHLQSPISPVSPGGVPAETRSASPGTSPLIPRKSPIRLPRLSIPIAWSSPWPWVAVGIVLFGGLAWGLVGLFQRFETSRDLSEETFQVPDAEPPSAPGTEPPSAPDAEPPPAPDAEPPPAPDAQDEDEFQIEIE
jgi:hypothetical protein